MSESHCDSTESLCNHFVGWTFLYIALKGNLKHQTKDYKYVYKQHSSQYIKSVIPKYRPQENTLRC